MKIVLRAYYEDPSFGQTFHNERLTSRLLEIDGEIEDIQLDRNRLLSELFKAKNTISFGQRLRICDLLLRSEVL